MPATILPLVYFLYTLFGVGEGESWTVKGEDKDRKKITAVYDQQHILQEQRCFSTAV